MPLRVVIFVWFCVVTAGTIIWYGMKNADACSFVPQTVVGNGVLKDDVIYQCSASRVLFHLASANHGKGYKSVLITGTGDVRLDGWAGTEPKQLKPRVWLFPYALNETATFLSKRDFYLTVHFIRGR